MIENLVTYPRLAAAIRDNYATDPVFCTRLVRQTVQHLTLLTDEAEIAEFHAEPPSTGSAEWDALIAGVAVHTWSLGGHLKLLPWMLDLKPLDNFWEPGGGPTRWRDWNLINTPPSLSERGVIFPSQWLQAV